MIGRSGDRVIGYWNWPGVCCCAVFPVHPGCHFPVCVRGSNHPMTAITRFSALSNLSTQQCMEFARCSFFKIRVHPAIHGLVPELAILRFQHPVSFVGEVEHFGRYLQPLQSSEKLE